MIPLHNTFLLQLNMGQDLHPTPSFHMWFNFCCCITLLLGLGFILNTCHVKWWHFGG